MKTNLELSTSIVTEIFTGELFMMLAFELQACYSYYE